jgi:hypothetical protein
MMPLCTHLSIIFSIRDLAIAAESTRGVWFVKHIRQLLWKQSSRLGIFSFAVICAAVGVTFLETVLLNDLSISVSA